MNYIENESFKKSNFIKVKNYRPFWSLSTWIEGVLLLHYSCTGYFNEINAKKRIFAAIWQTFMATLAVFIIYDFFKNRCFFNSDPPNSMNIIAFISAIFGATFFREMKDIHNKFSYLAGIFNDIIKIDPIKNADNNSYNKREHLLSCLGHDILIMSMWSHKSFKSVFKDILEKAVLSATEKVPGPPLKKCQLSSVYHTG